MYPTDPHYNHDFYPIEMGGLINVMLFQSMVKLRACRSHY